jgi:hypothetical protein
MKLAGYTLVVFNLGPIVVKRASGTLLRIPDSWEVERRCGN